MLYPLRFQPTFRRYLWGGRRLATVLNKPIGEGDDYAESWEVVDHGDDQSVVRFGDLAGRTLHSLVEEFGAELAGRSDRHKQFPLLFKFLDGNRHLSIQVHPNDEQAARLDPPDLGKTEAWVVLDARPGSLIYAGLRRGMGRDAVMRERALGNVHRCVHSFEPRVGDCIFVPAGVVHALGAGLLVAEIQQASDTTFRIYDWDRLDADGNPRPLHLDDAMKVIDFDYGPVAPQSPLPTERSFVERLVACDKFVLDRWRIQRPQGTADDQRFHILSVLDGAVEVAGDPADQPLTKGQTVLIPAVGGSVELTPLESSTLLDMSVPHC